MGKLGWITLDSLRCHPILLHEVIETGVYYRYYGFPLIKSPKDCITWENLAHYVRITGVTTAVSKMVLILFNIAVIHNILFHFSHVY